jgi:NAD-dependent SIR2 family protein deacetylase
MRLRGVDFPSTLIDAQENGSLVVFAGAGVSKPDPSNYPDFEGLANLIAGGALQRREREPIEQFLGRLVDKPVEVHERVRKILSNPDSAPNPLHTHLLKLFEAAGKVRLITTNFDTHFATAATKLCGHHEVEVFSAPALPLGDSFNGLVHLHGSVDRPPNRMILTDRDFGRAYLTDGWATRFLQRLFLTICRPVCWVQP